MFKISKRYIITSMYLLGAILFCLISYAVSNSLLVATDIIEDNLVYVSYEVLNEEVSEVSVTKNNTIIRPYKDEKVSIVKNYYDYSLDEESQKKAIYYYEDTYIQNSGIDYGNELEFTIFSILDGTIISITSDDIVGNTIKIKHDNNIISVYQSLSEVFVKENDYIHQGDSIGISGINDIGKDLGNHLHFELYKDGILVNPENYLDKSLGE